MPAADVITKAVHGYVEGFANADVEAIVALFAPEARVEDPVGTEPKIGHDAIRDFYTVSIATGAKLVLQEPIRVAERHAAFAFEVHLNFQNQDMVIDVIDIFVFNDEGLIISMTAYFGPENMRT